MKMHKEKLSDLIESPIYGIRAIDKNEAIPDGWEVVPMPYKLQKYTHLLKPVSDFLAEPVIPRTSKELKQVAAGALVNTYLLQAIIKKQQDTIKRQQETIQSYSGRLADIENEIAEYQEEILKLDELIEGKA